MLRAKPCSDCLTFAFAETQSCELSKEAKFPKDFTESLVASGGKNISAASFSLFLRNCVAQEYFWFVNRVTI